MKITRINSDVVCLDEKNFNNEIFQSIPKIHLIKLNFRNPTVDRIKKVMELYPKTNRFIIEDHIREYNSILKRTSKKYYVMNNENSNMISFFRKNNKILFNFGKLNLMEYNYFTDEKVFVDILKNTEVIAIDKSGFDIRIDFLEMWKGNCILLEENKSI